MGFAARPVRVRTPATSANLGPAFDAAGLALALHDDVDVTVVGPATGGPADLRFDVEGEGAGDIARDETHLVAATVLRTLRLLDVDPPALEICCRNRIPHGRGLGSSAAAIVAGVLVARELVPGGVEALPLPRVLDLVADPRLNPASVVLQSAIPSLSILPIGSRQAWEANSSPSITPTIERLGRTYPNHLVILDAPPCLSTSDPHTIAAHVGQVVMVVEAERTQRSEVEAALDLVRVCPNITVMLNKVKLTSSNTFGAYDYYGSYT